MTTDPAPNAQFFDGLTAGRKSARVEQESTLLRICAHPDGATLAEWPYASIEVIVRPTSGRAGQFTSRQQEDARLSIADAGLAAAVAERAARHAGPDRHYSRLVSIATAAAGVLAVVAIFYLAWTPLLDLAARAIPQSWERQLGRSVISTLAPAEGHCRDKEGQAALDRLVAKLVTGVGTDLPFEVRVSRNKAVNAFAMPGGYIVLLSGLIDQATTADEVAGVLAHEMAHVSEHHSVRLMTRHYGMAMLGGILIGNTNLSSALSTFGLLAYSRDFEVTADARAVEILKQSGIRGGGLATFFERMEKKQNIDPSILRYLSSHPPSAERRELAQRTAGTGTAAMSEADWNSLRAICRES